MTGKQPSRPVRTFDEVKAAWEAGEAFTLAGDLSRDALFCLGQEVGEWLASRRSNRLQRIELGPSDDLFPGSILVRATRPLPSGAQSYSILGSQAARGILPDPRAFLPGALVGRYTLDELWRVADR